MSQLVRSESIQLLSAVEGTFGVQPTSGWRQHQPNTSGVKNYIAAIKRVARSPLSKYRANEKGDIVDLDALPAIDHDLNKDLLDFFAPGIFLAQGQFVGTGGVNAPNKFYPTAVTSSQFTIPTAAFALVQSVLVYARGFANAANNGLFVVQAASTTTAIKVTGTVAEASPPTNATVEVCGFQCASADLVVASATQLTTTALNLTTLNIPLGSWLWVGGGTAAVPGALGFATAGDRGWIRVTAIAAGSLTFDRPTQAWSADVGTGKTIQIFFGAFFSNVAIDNANYLETSYALELSQPGLDTGAATDYSYASGCYVDKLSLNFAAQNKVVATVSFKGKDIGNPSTSRATGASTAIAPLATSAYNTVTEMSRLRFADKTAGGNYNAPISVDIDSWTLDLMNNITAQKQQGVFGANRMITGKCNVQVKAKAFLVQPDPILANRDNRDMMFEAMLRNGDAAMVWDLPRCEITTSAPDYPANGPVTFSEQLDADRDTTLNFVVGCTIIPFVPAT